LPYTYISSLHGDLHSFPTRRSSDLRQSLIETWHDGKILGGDEWNKAISEQMQKASIILLLVSIDFINSYYCYEVELEEALELHEDRKSTRLNSSHQIISYADFCLKK